MHKSQYQFIKKINNCDVTIKSTITKRTISRKKKVVETIKTKKKKNHQKRNKIGEGERVLTFLSLTTWKEQGREAEMNKQKFV